MNNDKYDNAKFSLKVKKTASEFKESMTLYKVIFILFVLGVIISEGVILGRLNNIDLQYEMMKKEHEEEIIHNRKVNEEILQMLKTIRNEQKEKIKAQNISYQQQKTDTENLKYDGIHASTDLGDNINISVETMDKIINYYEENIRHTAFVNKGYAFVEAAKLSGLNPIYLFAHAACESDYGMSEIAQYNNNYFGIGAFDSNPNNAYYMGDSVEEGIINGAIWIKKNYYDKGMETLEEMNPVYCTNGNWANMIISIANFAISLI